MFTRYAVYYTPETTSDLAKFGASWLGWDSALGRRVNHPECQGLDVAALTNTPRKYGFHGTIKPPFRLAQGLTEAALCDALADLCSKRVRVEMDGLQLARLGRFLALVPKGNIDALNALAAGVVQNLDTFRAAASDAELAKRRQARLTPTQDAYLLRWGYPYVLDQFRFHMTLTDRLDRSALLFAETTLGALLEQFDFAPFWISDLTLMGEADGGEFHQIARFSLASGHVV